MALSRARAAHPDTVRALRALVLLGRINIDGREGTRLSRSCFPAVNAGRGKLLSYGYPAVRILARLVCWAFFYFYKSQARHETRAHHAIFRAAAFMSCLTSTQVPRGAPHVLHDKTVSLVGASGRSSRPPHFPHLKLLSEVVLLAEVEVPPERLLRIAGHAQPCSPPNSQITRMIGIGMPISHRSNPRPMGSSFAGV